MQRTCAEVRRICKGFASVTGSNRKRHAIDIHWAFVDASGCESAVGGQPALRDSGMHCIEPLRRESPQTARTQ